MLKGSLWLYQVQAQRQPQEMKNGVLHKIYATRISVELSQHVFGSVHAWCTHSALIETLNGYDKC